MLDFYQSYGSACCRKVHFVLHEKGLSWTDHLLDLRRGDQLLPEYRKLNPNAEVPTLVHDGAPIIQSTVIMEYLDDVFPDPPLRPANPVTRARMRVWNKWPDEGGHTGYSYLAFAVSHRYLAHDTTPGWVEAQLQEKPDAERQRRQRDAIELGLDAPQIPGVVRRFDKLLGDMEAALCETPFLAGEAVTLADFAIVPYLARLSLMTFDGMWEESRPHVTEWFARMRARDSYRKVITEKESPRVAELMRTHGGAAWPKIKAMIAG